MAMRNLGECKRAVWGSSFCSTPDLQQMHECGGGVSYKTQLG